MQKFSDYIKNNKNEETKNNFHNKEESLKSKESLQKKIDEYSEYSSDKLLSEFMKLTIEKKKRGELTDSELLNLKNTISPMLSAEQRKSLDALIQMVKDVK